MINQKAFIMRNIAIVVRNDHARVLGIFGKYQSVSYVNQHLTFSKTSSDLSNNESFFFYIDSKISFDLYLIVRPVQKKVAIFIIK